MKVSFPQMGRMGIAVKALLQECGLEVILPPTCTQRTLSLGTRHSPETACLPLKINVGNFIEAIEEGAEAIIMGGGCGPCRLGYYGEVQREILRDLGYQVEFIVIEPPGANWIALYQSLRWLLGGIRPAHFLRALTMGWQKGVAVDELDALALRLRPRVLDANQLRKILDRGMAQIDQADSVTKIKSICRETHLELEDLPRHRGAAPIRIGLVGEVYVILEPFVTMNLEEKLASLGAEVHRSVYLSDWVRENLFLRPLGLYKDHIKPYAKGYLDVFVGGHGLESIAHTVKYAREGYDGVVHVAPFTCMPEIIARSIFPAVIRNEEIPVLSLDFDEHTGEAGLITRLEAFTDLLSERRRERA